MSFASRVYGTLELELSRRLSFSIRPPRSAGREPRLPQENSNYRFTVWLRNDADFPLRTIRGTIQSTRWTRFQPVRYSLSELRPGQSELIATVEALIVGRPGRGSVLDQLAVVNVSAAADLSTVTFQEWDRPLGIGAPSIRPADRALSPRAHAARPADRVRSRDLSTNAPALELTRDPSEPDATF